MSHAPPTIESVAARALVAPLSRPVRTAIGHVPAAPLVLIDVRLSDGVIGSAYVFAYTAAALGALHRLTLDIGAELKGQGAEPLERFAAFDRRFRLLGWQGLVGMAVSGLDMALWDAFAKRSGVTVAEALGARPKPIPPMTAMASLIRRPTLRRSGAPSRAVSGRSRSSSATATSRATSPASPACGR